MSVLTCDVTIKRSIVAALAIAKLLSGICYSFAYRDNGDKDRERARVSLRVCEYFPDFFIDFGVV